MRDMNAEAMPAGQRVIAVQLRRDAARGRRRRDAARRRARARRRGARPARRRRGREERRCRLGRSVDDERPVPAHAEAAVHAGPRVRRRRRVEGRRGRRGRRDRRRRARRRLPRRPAIARRLPGVGRLRVVRRRAGRGGDPRARRAVARSSGGPPRRVRDRVSRARRARPAFAAGETVLVHGASGSTGLAAVHVAKLPRRERRFPPSAARRRSSRRVREARAPITSSLARTSTVRRACARSATT